MKRIAIALALVAALATGVGTEAAQASTPTAAQMTAYTTKSFNNRAAFMHSTNSALSSRCQQNGSRIFFCIVRWSDGDTTDYNVSISPTGVVRWKLLGHL